MITCLEPNKNSRMRQNSPSKIPLHSYNKLVLPAAALGTSLCLDRAGTFSGTESVWRWLDGCCLLLPLLGKGTVPGKITPRNTERCKLEGKSGGCPFKPLLIFSYARLPTVNSVLPVSCPFANED